MKILLVDDNKAITDAVSFYCESEQINCDTITDGKSGLSAIRKGHYDLVLLDVAMPEFTGLDIIKSLKADGLLEKMNIVVFTASSDHKMFEEITKSGVKEVLKKPCSIYDLGELIKRFSPADST
jgi:DNA-binding response OmpR family regulator